MIGVVVAAHGVLASTLLSCARAVTSTSTRVLAVDMTSHESATAFEVKLRASIVECGVGMRGVLVLTDMFGGTPSNVGLMLHRPQEIEVLTGVNLPMLIKALQVGMSEVSLDEAAMKVRGAGQRSIVVASEALKASESAQG